MAIVVPNVGELELLDKMLKDALSVDESLILKLYSNDYTPVQSSTDSNFTEATFTGYSAKTLSRTGWSAASTVSNKAESSHSPQSWTAGSTQTIYGYWVEGATSGTCLWAEKFSSSRAMGSGDVLTITPKFSLDSEN